METVASYFAKFPETSQKRMQQIRTLIMVKTLSLYGILIICLT